MVIRDWRIAEILPCIADESKIRVTISTDADLGDLLPYLASSKAGSNYSEEQGILSHKSGLRLVSIDRHGRIGITSWRTNSRRGKSPRE